jgi:branched-chain amino acid transport system permease protein
MAFEVVASSVEARRIERTPAQATVRAGLIWGAVAVYVALVGLYGMFERRWIIDQTVTLGQAVLLLIALTAGYRAALGTSVRDRALRVLAGVGAGAIAGALLAALVVLGEVIELRAVFVEASPVLFRNLTMNLGTWPGAAALVVLGAVLGLAGGALFVLPPNLRAALLAGAAVVGGVGLFHELIQPILQGPALTTRLQQAAFTFDGLKLSAALALFVAASAAMALWCHNRPAAELWYARLPAGGQVGLKVLGYGLLLGGLLLLPLVTNQFIAQVMMIVGLYILMGMGLNLELGLAGLIDLGFVAFFAIGAYTIGLLTAASPLAIANLSFWAALPFAVGAAALAGWIFGLPVLRVRGDYLAIATLGLGEIVRLLVLSDMLRPVLGGSQGVLNIPKPEIAGMRLADPSHLFYLTLALAALVAYCAWRLQHSRLGRAWLAIREDEDVAQALGINPVKVKLFAYTMGAGFAGVAGAIFAVMLGSVYPHSFQLLISINVLALIILGGLGSLPGVVIGALVLIGVPELLREFGEYRYLFYGITLILIMRLRPEGLWPAAVRRREIRVNGR